MSHNISFATLCIKMYYKKVPPAEIISDSDLGSLSLWFGLSGFYLGVRV